MKAMKALSVKHLEEICTLFRFFAEKNKNRMQYFRSQYIYIINTRGVDGWSRTDKAVYAGCECSP